ncbi:ribonuclease E inhibitor RraA/Dimethylmenaquinone methyltransferase [Xylogone sp. PMI_703]|nr:ribonuclease E inhibitor RraA/Dimethylmenaquinone methyltransferase [Xylogone sp. PMI_703]
MTPQTSRTLLLLKPRHHHHHPLPPPLRARYVQASSLFVPTVRRLPPQPASYSPVTPRAQTSYQLFSTSTRTSTPVPSSSKIKMSATPEQLAQLQQYTSCDISDALQKLKVPNCGFIPDLHVFPPPGSSTSSLINSVTIAPASTFVFAPKSLSANQGQLQQQGYPEANIPPDTHWVDNVQSGTIVVLKQPQGQSNAVCGGIMALRMKLLGVKGVVVAGRVRDMIELGQSGLPIFARGNSTVGTGAATVAHAMQVPLDIDGTIVKPGDLVFCDATEGVVVIPLEKVKDVLELLPRLTQADNAVIEAVKGGMSVKEAFTKFRG